MHPRRPIRRRAFYGKLKVIEIDGDKVVHKLLSNRMETWTVRKGKGADLGEGSFGTVRMESNEHGQIRAVKVIEKAKQKDLDIQREVLALKQLREHAWFVQLFGWFDNNEHIYLAMEYIENGDLHNYIGSSGRPENEARLITKQILMGLEVMHGYGICHRDLKPQNVLMSSLSPIRVVIADFGFAKPFKPDLKLLSMVGTASYMAPELWRGDYYGPAVDIWSMGCVVRDILTGSPSPRGSLALSAGLSQNGIQFVQSLMVVEPSQRPSAKKALRSPWIKEGTDDADESGKTLLHHAVLNDTVEMVRQLLENAAKLNEADCDGKTPFHLAAETGRQEVVKLLLEKEADKRAKDQAGQTPLHLAAECGHVEVVEMLMRELTEMNTKDYFGRTPLHAAAEGNRVDVAGVLAKDNESLKAKDNEGQTALHLACKAGHGQLVRTILDNGSDLDEADDFYGYTPLHFAAESGRLNVVDELLERGANINKRDIVEGRTALHLAAKAGHALVVKALASKGAERDQGDSSDGFTPLHLAVRADQREAIFELILHKHSVKVVDNDKITPRGWADLMGKVALSSLLRYTEELQQAGFEDELQNLVDAFRGMWI